MAAPKPPPRIELLRAQHDRTGFVCGKKSLDQYFQRQVTQDAGRYLATPFVMVMSDGTIGGFIRSRAQPRGSVICPRMSGDCRAIR